MSKRIIATYDNRASAQRAVEGLFRNGASVADISVLMTDETCGREFQIETGTKAAAGIGAGAATGGAIGALVAGLTAVGTMATGGTLLAAGPLVAALAGAGAGSAAGGLLGGDRLDHPLRRWPEHLPDIAADNGWGEL